MLPEAEKSEHAMMTWKQPTPPHHSIDLLDDDMRTSLFDSHSSNPTVYSSLNLFTTTT
jgi:hypothetical protein